MHAYPLPPVDRTAGFAEEASQAILPRGRQA